MNNFGKYALGFAAIVFIMIFCWYFSAIIAYVLIAVVVSFLGKPIIDLLGKVRIRGRELPSGAKSAITLTLLWLVFIVSFMTLIPLVAGEFQNLERVSVETVVSSLDSPLHELGVLLEKYGLIDDTTDLKHHLSRSLNSIIDTSKIGVFFGSLAGTVSGILIALFSISFISFFFLKDSGLFKNIVLAILPERYATSAVNALDSIQKLLVRYFVGILIEVLGVMMLNTIGLLILGFNLSNALVIGLISGILNVIPYIGPLIGIIVGILVGIVSNIGLPFYTDMLPLLIYMTMIMLFTQLIDNIVFQPFIYGTSVYAHPLEIFLVILMAGSIAGIPGMILAIPSYTVLRVILREFFSNYRLVKKITQGIER